MELQHPVFPVERIHGLRRTEYQRLAELGAFEDEKVELLYGQIVRMTPEGESHLRGVERVVELLEVALRRRARVVAEAPFAASEESEPEPDVVLVPLGDMLDDAPPRTALLVIEVAHSSLADDRRKASLYAAAGVPEYWIVNLVDAVVEAHRGPRAEGYAAMTRHLPGEELHVPGFEGVFLRASEVLGHSP